jgi:hypothetical protein
MRRNSSGDWRPPWAKTVVGTVAKITSTANFLKSVIAVLAPFNTDLHNIHETTVTNATKCRN